MTSDEKPDDAGPISFPVVVSKLPATGLSVRFEANDGERTSLAAVLDVLSVDGLRAELLLSPWQRDGVRVTGTVRGSVVQACVVSLDPVPRTSKLARIVQPTGELILDPDGADVPEVFDGDRIDLGAAVAEAVALGLDPYPRAPNAEFRPSPAEIDGDDRVSPFAALRQLTPENENEDS